MNNEYNIELIVPIFYQKYNINISKNITIAEAIIIINKIFINSIKKDILENHNLYLYNRDTGEKYNLRSFVYETDIENGTTLILV